MSSPFVNEEGQTAEEFLAEFFEFELCSSCGLDAPDHTVMMVLGPIAVCTPREGELVTFLCGHQEHWTKPMDRDNASMADWARAFGECTGCASGVTQPKE